MVEGKNIILGVTGGIAAYKAAELTREYVKKGANVTVIMTKSAMEFITPLTLQTLSGNPVYNDMFTLTGEWEIGHISLADSADAMVIAPATANIIGKIASGIADDLLSTAVMATKAPVLLCPAMNTNMYANSIVQENMKRLRALDYTLLEPGFGELACKVKGPGRLPPISEIVEETESLLTEKDLGGQHILVTAGPTREAFDPVRFISNYSSGKMGYALASMAKRRGANVTLVSGPTALSSPAGVTFIPVTSAEAMRTAVMQKMEEATVIIKAAAVADYRPANMSDSKIKKKEGLLNIALERNPDIIAEIGRKKGTRILVGFAMETENLIENAQKKLKAKNMDLIVANDLSQPGSGFQYDTNIVKIIDTDGEIESLPLLDKIEVANRILDRILKLYRMGK